MGATFVAAPAVGPGTGRCRGGFALPRVQTESNIYRVRHSESDRDREVGREAEKGWDTKKGTVIKIHRQRRRSQQGQRYRAERQAEGQIPDRQGKGDGKRVATE